MSVQALGWVFDHSPARGSDRLVLLAIANHAGGEPVEGPGQPPAWEAWPGIELLRREAGLDRARTVNDALARLERAGALVRVVNGAPDERIRRDRRPNLYRVLLDHGVTCGVTRCRWCGVTRGDTHGVTRGDRTGCRDASPEPSVEPSGEPQPPAGGEGRLFDQPTAKATAKTKRAYSDEADALAKAEWERRPTKPVCGFVALRTRVQEALDAGHSPEAIAAAMPNMSVFSRNAFDFALSGTSRPGRPGRPSRRMVPDDDRGGDHGEVVL